MYIKFKLHFTKTDVSIKNFFIKYDLVTFTKEVLNGKLYFLYSVAEVAFQRVLEIRISEISCKTHAKPFLLFYQNNY